MVPGISGELNRKFIERVRKVNKELSTPIPVVGVATGGTYTARFSREAEEMGIPMYLSPERAARVIKALVDYGRWLKHVGTFEEYVEKFRKLINF